MQILRSIVDIVQAGILSTHGLLAVTQVMPWTFGGKKVLMVSHTNPSHFRHSLLPCGPTEKQNETKKTTTTAKCMFP